MTGNARWLEAGSGDPVLLLHSISGSASGWREWMRILADAGFRAVAPELPGFGAPPLEPVFRHEHYLGLLDELMSAADGSREWAVVGDSLGGLLALQLCERGRIGRCVLLETPAVFPYPWLRPVARVAVDLTQRPLIARFGARLVGSGLGRRVMGAFDLIYTADRTVALQEASALSVPPLPFLASVMEAIAAADLRECARRVRQPVLMVVGSRDRWAPTAEAERFVRLLQRGRLHVEAGFRHGDAFHRPDRIAPIVIEHLMSSDQPQRTDLVAPGPHGDLQAGWGHTCRQPTAEASRG